MSKRFNSAFTLIELLVVISIIGILIALSVFGLQGARESSRDARRKADLELIRSGLEIYKSDCNVYPQTLGSVLVGDNSTTSCSSSNTYIAIVPIDPQTPTRRYPYARPTTTNYVLCASLEQSPGGSPDITNCGSCGSGVSCNYKVTNP